MNQAPVDTPARLLRDLKKLLRLHQDFGIESYPRSTAIEHFLTSPPPLTQAKKEARPVAPALRVAATAPKISPQPARSNQTLAEIQAELGDCRRCPLHKTRKQLVFGAGNPKAALLIVGDFPGPDDEQAGTPFSGETGELLTKMLKAIGLTRHDVYLTTVVKCRTTGMTDASAEQVATCLPFLLRQIDAVGPKVICAMGQLAAQTLLRSKTPLIRLRGSFHDYLGTPLMPTFHPAFLLKNPEMKRATWIDLQLMQAELNLGK